MGWQELTLALVGTLAWPAVLITFALVVRWALRPPRTPRCSGCGWRSGHDPNCRVLESLVNQAMIREDRELRRRGL